MSAFREDVDDFLDWANHEADRTDWPPEWSGFTFTESGPAPRRIYPDYLADRLGQAAREALAGVTLVEADGDVVDLDLHDEQVDVVVDNLSWRTGEPDAGRVRIRADHVVLATGLERKYPVFAEAVADHPAFVRSPYSADGIERIVGLRRDAVVAVVGTLLSAYDSAALLLRRGHTGKIYLISRSGLTPRTYPPDHRHHVLTLPPPELIGDSYEGRDEFIRRFKDEWRRACEIVTREHPEVSPAVVTERVSKSWEPYLPAILSRIPTADLCALLDTYGSLLAVLRVGVMAYTAEIVDAAMDSQVVVAAGKVEEIHKTRAGTLVVTTSTQRVEADLVISNFGRESNYERVESELWANLLRKGVARAHQRTGRGVEVDRHGNLVGPTGEPSGPVSVVGSPREGDEIVRNGRTGAFTFNLAAIKNHTVDVAATVLCRLESCYDVSAAPASEHGLDQALSYSVTLDVRRMTARRRDYREALVAHLEDSLQAIHGVTARNGGLPVSDRALRSAISNAAATKLKDLSVTPRDLRSILGLEHRLESIG